VDVELAARIRLQRGALGAVEQPGIHARIGVDGHRAVRAVGRGHQPQPAALLPLRKALLLVAGLDAALLGQDPDLQEVGGPVLGMVELAVHDAPARAHALHVAGRDGLHVAQRVAVRELTVEDVADDLHVAVAVRAEALPGGHAVFVDHAQVAEAHVLGIVVVGEREAVERLQPAVVGEAPLFGSAQRDHGSP